MTFSRPVAAVLFVVIFALWIAFRGVPSMTGVVRILVNLIASIAAIWAMAAVYGRSEWKQDG
jgi:hypothetical protein